MRIDLYSSDNFNTWFDADDIQDSALEAGLQDDPAIQAYYRAYYEYQAAYAACGASQSTKGLYLAGMRIEARADEINYPF